MDRNQNSEIFGTDNFQVLLMQVLRPIFYGVGIFLGNIFSHVLISYNGNDQRNAAEIPIPYVNLAKYC